MIDRDQLIGQEQMDVLVIRRAVLGQIDLFEMKRDVIAKGAIQPKALIPLVTKQITKGTYDRKQAGLLAAFFFGEPGSGLFNHAIKPVFATGHVFDMGVVFKRA